MVLNYEQPNIHDKQGAEKIKNLNPEKEKIWVRHKEAIKKIVDRLGKPIDEGIEDTITALQLHGFPTTQSCEGHITENGASYPWVEVTSPAPNGWKNDKEKQQMWTIENLKQRRRMLDTLSEFYQQRKVPFEMQIAFRPIGMFGGFRIQTIGSETIILLPPEEQKKKTQEYKREIDAFTEFLRQKFFAE